MSTQVCYEAGKSLWEVASPGGKVLVVLMFTTPFLVIVLHDAWDWVKARLRRRDEE